MRHSATQLRLGGVLAASFLLFVLVIAGLPNKGVAADPAQSTRVYTFGVVPQQAASKLARQWAPILDYLSAKTGYTLRFATAANIPTFEKRVAQGDYDFAYMNPYHYTVFSEAAGYMAFAKQKGKRIQGIVVVRKDSPITDIKQLAGKTLAFPAPAAFAASVLPRAHFQNNDIAITPRYVKSHDSVYRSVAKGLFPAGGGIGRTFNSVAQDVRNDLRILWRTEKFTPHAFAVHQGVPGDVANAISHAFIAMGGNEKGKALLGALKFNQGVEAATHADWNDVRALGIDLLGHLVGG